MGKHDVLISALALGPSGPYGCPAAPIPAGVLPERPQQTMSAEIGKPFPDFALPNQDGKIQKLGDFAGKWLVVYVYPKDDTPGCTIQGKSFTATKKQFDDAGVSVLGLSEDGVESHKSFCDKFSFTIDLLADPERKLLGAAGVGQSDYKGTLYWDRTSFVIDPAGVLRKVYLKVKPEGHERLLLEDIAALKAQA
jgi:peroxiredoxin Q/BCP